MDDLKAGDRVLLAPDHIHPPDLMRAVRGTPLFMVDIRTRPDGVKEIVLAKGVPVHVPTPVGIGPADANPVPRVIEDVGLAVHDNIKADDALA